MSDHIDQVKKRVENLFEKTSLNVESVKVDGNKLEIKLKTLRPLLPNTDPSQIYKLFDQEIKQLMDILKTEFTVHDMKRKFEINNERIDN